MKRKSFFVITLIVCVLSLAACGSKKEDTAAGPSYFQYSEEEQIKSLEDAQVGESVFYGSYEQDNDTSNGPETIEWLVLTRDGDNVLLISKYGLECIKYNESGPYEAASWDISTLRTWLNGEFLANSFTSEQQGRIIETELFTDTNPDYDSAQGESTVNEIFPLNSSEFQEYVMPLDAASCAATAHAIANGVDPNDAGNCIWWLRTVGRLDGDEVCVTPSGSVYTNGYGAFYEYIAVRPAMWVSIA